MSRGCLDLGIRAEQSECMKADDSVPRSGRLAILLLWLAAAISVCLAVLQALDAPEAAQQVVLGLIALDAWAAVVLLFMGYRRVGLLFNPFASNRRPT